MTSWGTTLWSVLGSKAPVPGENDGLPVDLVDNLRSSKQLLSELEVAERNLVRFQSAAKEFATSVCAVCNDVTQLATQEGQYRNLKEAQDVIATAAEVQALGEHAIPDCVTSRVIHRVTRWKDGLSSLILKLEELKRMSQQSQRLRQHISHLEETRINLVKSGRWTPQNSADLKKAQDAQIAWQSKCDGMTIIVQGSVEGDLIEARRAHSLVILQLTTEMETAFWRTGAEMCRQRANLTKRLENDAPTQPVAPKAIKKKKKAKAMASRELSPMKSVPVIAAPINVPEMMTFDWFTADADPFSSELDMIVTAPPPAIHHAVVRLSPSGPVDYSEGRQMNKSMPAIKAHTFTTPPNIQYQQQQARHDANDPFLCLNPLTKRIQ